MRATFNAIFDRLLDACAWLACLLLVFQVVSVSAEVVARYFFGVSFGAVTALNEWSLVFLTFLGAAWLQREGGHTSDNSLLAMFPAWVRPMSIWFGWAHRYRIVRVSGLVRHQGDVGELCDQCVRFLQAARSSNLSHLRNYPDRKPAVADPAVADLTKPSSRGEPSDGPKGRCLRHRKDSDDGMVRCLAPPDG